MIRIAQLHRQELWFPPLEDALDEPNGLLAFGGDLRPERILAAYRRGIFPWYQDDQPILWWSPEPRAVLFPERIKISKSMRKLAGSGALAVSMDRDFAAVIAACAELNDKRTGTWITAPMQRAYNELHRLGYAHSVEVWQRDKLVGGLYGLGLGQVFFGESMFSRIDNASKLALIRLCTQLQEWGFAVLDCQVSSPHLLSMGACEIRRAEFQRLLQQHAEQPCAVNGRSWSAPTTDGM